MVTANDILPSDLTLDPRQVQTGDVIIGHHWEDSRGRDTRALAKANLVVFCDEPRTVVSVRGGIWFVDAADGSRTKYCHLDSEVKLVVRRTGQPHRSIAEFPHRCPRCGTQAYVGLFSIEHEDGGGDCPPPF